MRFYLVRHAHALSGAEDSERRLSPKGIEEARRLGEFLRTASISPEQIWHSPLTRAKETAHILAESLAATERLHEAEGLVPEDEPRLMAERLRREERSVLLVGHDPHISALATLLVGGIPARPLVEFSKGTALCLERLDVGLDWRLSWLVSPDVLNGLVPR